MKSSICLRIECNLAYVFYKYHVQVSNEFLQLHHVYQNVLGPHSATPSVRSKCSSSEFVFVFLSCQRCGLRRGISAFNPCISPFNLIWRRSLIANRSLAIFHFSTDLIIMQWTPLEADPEVNFFIFNFCRRLLIRFYSRS